MPVITVRNLRKVFHMHRGPLNRLRAAFAEGERPGARQLCALDGVSFQLEPGASLGVVGPNGAGKSTLLKILAGILVPTSGEIDVEGRVASIIELGAGFHPEFTGRQNFFMNGAILGFSQDELEALYDRAVAFSGLGEFMEMPIKTYSSGMIARLAFTIAIHAEPDVLIVDEALSVGDAVFSHRCLARIQAMREKGTALVLVTHDVNAVKQVCEEAILLDKGTVVAQGTPDSVLTRYQTMVAERLSDESTSDFQATAQGETLRYGTFESVIEGFTVTNAAGEQTTRFNSRDTMTITMAVRFATGMDDPVFGIMLRNRYGIEVFGANTVMRKEKFGPVPAGALRSVTFNVDLVLAPGTYAVSLAVHDPEGAFHDYQVEALTVEILPPVASVGVANLPLDICVADDVDLNALATKTPAPAKGSA